MVNLSGDPNHPLVYFCEAGIADTRLPCADSNECFLMSVHFGRGVNFFRFSCLGDEKRCYYKSVQSCTALEMRKIIKKVNGDE